ncbi:MAG: polysaccharide deacetylase family protein [Candidatus Krumholzibacteria bacterium]|nr:polysaccharide deacetylase family protein [Candidatus Krumholzibacteria bacterium]
MGWLTVLREDVRNGTIVAMVSVALFVALLAFRTPFDPTRAGASIKDSNAGDSWITGYIAPTYDTRRAGDAAAVPVLCHHFLREDTDALRLLKILGALFLNLPVLKDMDVWTQTASEFEKQIVYLKERGYVSVDLDDLLAWQVGRETLPRKSVVITFDDGDRSVLDVAYPILKRHGMKATLFVVTARVGKQWERVNSLTWDELRFLQESGVFSIESHTHNLHHKVKTTKGRLPVFRAMSRGLFAPADGEPWQTTVFNDLVASRRAIATHLGRDARHLAWPYGFGNAGVDSVAVAAGFRTMSTLEKGMNLQMQTARGHLVESSALALAANPAGGPIALEVFPSYVSAYPLPRISWDRFKIKRYTITARTTIRGFAEMMLE